MSARGAPRSVRGIPTNGVGDAGRTAPSLERIGAMRRIATLTLSVSLLTGCSAMAARQAQQAPDTSYDQVERTRLHGPGRADTSYDAVERTRVQWARGGADRSYDEIERVRLGR